MSKNSLKTIQFILDKLIESGVVPPKRYELRVNVDEYGSGLRIDYQERGDTRSFGLTARHDDIEATSETS